MSIPPATAKKLQETHPEGSRHQAKLDIALSLIGNGMSPSAVAQELRDKFPAASEGEIKGVIDWCARKNPTPTEYRNGRTLGTPESSPQNGHRIAYRPPMEAKPQMTPEEAVARLVQGQSYVEEEWMEASPISIPESPAEHAALLISHLYEPGEFLCGVRDYGIKPKDGKSFPVGAGEIHERQAWLDRIESKGMWQSAAGCWWRMNPVKERGSGKDGASCDEDVTDYRFALVEHDKLPLQDQLNVLAKFLSLSLPIVCVIATGGKSYHAWVKLAAKDQEDYAAKIARLLEVTKPLGFDHNRNPSRLARIPGAKRKLGALGEGWQRLLFLNPNPKEFDWDKFETGATPIKNIVQGTDLVARVREWMKPRLSAFTLSLLRGGSPEEGIYFRDAELTLWTGTSGHGKSSLVKQTMLELMASGIPFFVASFEHLAEDLCEGLARALHKQKPTSDEVVKMLHDFGSLVTFYDIVGESTPSDLLEHMELAHKRFQCRHYFIDSLMRLSGLEEDYPAQTQFVNDVQCFLKRTKAHVHLVTHPRKIDETQRARKMDVKGSGNIPNNADNILSVRRNVQKQEAEEDGKSVGNMHDAEVSVEKQRATGWQGVFKLRFDPPSRTFSRFTPTQPKSDPNYNPHPRRNQERD